MAAERSGGGVKVEADRKTDRQLDKEKASKWESYPQEIRSAVERIFGESAPNQSQKNVIAGLMSGEPKSQINDMTVNAVFGLRRMEQLAKELGSAPKTTDEIRAGLRSLASLPATAGVTSPGAEAETVDLMEGYIFPGNLEPGQISQDKRVVVGNFRIKKQAEEVAKGIQGAGVVPYLNGKFKRGWVVLQPTSESRSLEGARIERGRQEDERRREERRVEQEARRVQAEKENAERAKEQAKRDAIPAPKTPGALPFTETRKALLAQVDEAIAKAPDPKDFLDKAKAVVAGRANAFKKNAGESFDDFKKRLNDYIANAPLELAKEMATDSLSPRERTVKFTAGTANYKIPNTREAMEQFRKLVAGSIRSTPQARESTVLPKLTGEEMDMVRNAKETGRLEDPFIRGLLDRATDGQFDSLRLSDRYTRVAPGVVMPKEGAEALAALKRGEQPGFDVLGTPAESLRDVTSAWDARGIRHAVFEKGGVITLNDIRIPEGERNAGLGTQAMQELTRYADSKGARIALSPSLDFGATSLPRLKDFYKRLGFVENKGRNRDFAISESMIREPSSATLGTPAERQTDTPEFRRWFGDSKVVDARGKPLVVYHGTTKDFDVFDVARAGSNIDTGYLGTAAGYFTDRADIADYYSRRDATGSATYPVYLSLKNPFMWGKKTRGVQGLYWNGERLPDEIHDEVIRATGFKFDGKIYPPDNEVAERDLSLAVRRVLMRKGYDGVIANDSKGKPMEFVAFGPEQIKSAIGNSGAFDPANPSILGTPADTAPEKRVSQSPRTERSGGFAVPDQVYAADRPFTVLQDEARAHVAKVGEARAVEDALDDASALPGDTKQTIILNAFKALSARMLDPNTSASEQESLTREMETLSARANPGTRSVARELSARQQYNRDQRVASPMQHVEEVRKRQEGAIGPDGNAALDDAEGELNKPVREVSNEIAKRAKEKAKGVKVSKGMIEDYLRKLEEENPDSIAVVALIKAMERNPADRAQAIRDFIDETRKTLWVEYRDAIAAAAEKTAKGPGKKKGKALLQVLPDDIQKIITDAIPKADAKGVPFSAQDMANRINDILARPEQFKDALGAARRQIGASEMDDARKQAALDALASLSSGQNIVGDMLNKIVKSVFDDMDLTPKQAARMGNVKSDEIAGEVSKRVAALFSGDVAKQMSREVSSIVGNMLNDARSQIREQLTSAEIKKQFLTAEEVKQADALLATGTVEEIAAFLGTRKSPQENERIAALTKELSEKKAKLSAILRKNLYQLSKEDQAQVIRDAFKAMQTTVGEIAKQHVTRTNATAKDLARRLVEEAGLSQAVASQVAADLDAAARKMIAEAREKALAKLKAKAEADTPRAKKIVTAIGKLTTLNNLGALTRADLMKAVAKELNLPEVRAEDMRRIAELADKVETAPNGLARSRAQRDLMVAVRVAQGISAADVGLSVWLSNLLSGPMTQVGNLVGNSMHTSAQIMALAMTNPSRARFAFSGWVDGLGAGFTHARDILKTGTSLREMGELNESTKTGDIGNVLEAVNYERDFKRLPKNLARGLQIHANAMRYVSRAMRAADAVFFYPAKEAYAQVMTAKLLEGEYKGKELVQKVRESLGMAPDQFIRFTRQAEAEGFTDSLDKAIRVHQLIEEARANSGAVQKTDAASNEFGKETTYNQEPVGTAGIVYRIAREGVNKLPALRLILPFLRTPTNVFNASLNFTPLGALRAGMGTTALNAAEKLAEQSAGFKPLVPLGKAAAWLNPGGTKDTDGKTTKQFTAEERARLYFQSVAGTIGMATIAAAALAEADDEDPFFTITAKGTGDWKKNEQLQQAGWRPFSIKVGNNYYNYRDTPFLLPLAAIGHIVDAKRYQKTKDTLAGRNPYLDALFRMPPTIFETSMLSGLGIIADVATGDFSPAKMEAFVANSATSAIIPNAVKQVDRFVSQERRDIDGIGGRVGASVPVLRQTGSVETDVLGEAVTTSPGDRLFSTGTDDELRQVLRDKKAFISVPDKDTRLDGRTMTEEEFKAYYRFYGEEMGRRLRPMTATLRRMQPGEQIGKLVDRVEADAREAAKAKVRQTVRRVPVLPDL
jgi:GNAT superfamily N-acetyltransferase